MPAIAAAILAGFFGFALGHVHARASRAWADYQSTKNALPRMRSAAWGLRGSAAGWWTVAGIVVAGLILAARNG